MEMSIVPSGALKIKGKFTTFLINGSDPQGAQAYFLLGNKTVEKLPDDALILEGAGEYEISGVKITGVSAPNGVVYTMILDRMSIAIGSVKAFESLQKTIQESQVVIIDADAECDAAFISNFSPSVIVFSGVQAKACAGTIAKENVQTTGKYGITAEKLPQETETYILANGK